MAPDVAHPRQEVDQQGRLSRPEVGVVAEAGADEGHGEVGGVVGPQRPCARRGRQPGAAAAMRMEELAGDGVEHRPRDRLPVSGREGSPVTAATETAYDGMP